jgi:cystathionine beta-lyase/cystathionine gamma-synthase
MRLCLEPAPWGRPYLRCLRAYRHPIDPLHHQFATPRDEDVVSSLDELLILRGAKSLDDRLSGIERAIRELATVLADFIKVYRP